MITKNKIVTKFPVLEGEEARFKIRIRKEDSETGEVSIEGTGDYSIAQMDAIIANLQEQITDWQDNKSICQEI